MKKILNEWKKFINESVVNDEQVRINIGKKMNSILFKAVGPSANPESYSDYGPDLLKKYGFLYWSVFGTKMERARGDKIYRPEIGFKFVEQKVNRFVASLDADEKAILQTDIPQIAKLLRSGDVPKSPVQIPVELSGHSGVDPSFRVPMFGRRSIDDWGMGGTIKDPSGDNYIFYVLDSISNKLPPPNPASKVSDQEVRSSYFMSETKEDYDARMAPTKPNRHFSPLMTSGMSYEEMVAKLKGGK